MGFKDNLVKEKDGSYVLKSKSKKVKKKGTCIECGENSAVRNLLYEYDTEDVMNVRNYIEDHLTTHTTHKSMKAIWCGTCNALVKYKVQINK